MSGAWAVCKRDVKAYFTTPVGYVVLGTFALICGLLFNASFLAYALATESPSTYDLAAVPDFEEYFFSPFLVGCASIMMFIGPLITMRLFAEEHNQGTAEMLFTFPLRERDIIAGKYAAGLAIILAQVGVLAVHVIIMSRYVPVEPTVLVFGLCAVFMMGSAIVSLGLFVSALCRSPITAATVTFGLFLVFFMVGYFGEDLSEDNPAPAAWSEEMRTVAGTAYSAYRTLITELPMQAHAETMAEGIFQPADIAYYVLFSAFFLFLTQQALAVRRWRA